MQLQIPKKVFFSYNSVHIYDCHNVNILHHYPHNLTLNQSLYQRPCSYSNLQSEPNVSLPILRSSLNVHLTIINSNLSITSIHHNIQLIKVIITISSPKSQPIHTYKNKQGIHKVLHSTRAHHASTPCLPKIVGVTHEPSESSDNQVLYSLPTPHIPKQS